MVLCHESDLASDCDKHHVNIDKLGGMKHFIGISFYYLGCYTLVQGTGLETLSLLKLLLLFVFCHCTDTMMLLPLLPRTFPDPSSWSLCARSKEKEKTQIARSEEEWQTERSH